tara:strand:- start:1206 stop:2420 length:1215 start_codon:yes stop_codon:yes gene_type:complete
MIKIFSMFSGVGGFELGFQQANLQTQVVGFCEIDKYASQILETKFQGVKNYGDATTIDETKLPNFDILVGGFPCQAFSMAGKRKGFDEARGTLFFDVARILAHKKPRNFILENVKGLLSHNKGKTFETILGILSDLGYIVEWELLNSKNYGVPQSRERVYIVGHLRGQSQPKVFSFRKSTEKSNQNPKELTKNIGQGQRVYSTNGASVSIKAGGGGQGGKTGLYKIPQATKQGYEWANLGDSVNLQNLKSKTRRGRVGKQIAQTLDTGNQQYAIVKRNGRVKKDQQNASTLTGGARGDGNHSYTDWIVQPTITPSRKNKSQNGRRFKDNEEPMFTLTQNDVHGVMLNETQIRRLTPIECERLQGFPDNWTEGLSDTQRYKCMGNAVTTNVVEWVVTQLYKKEMG